MTHDNPTVTAEHSQKKLRDFTGILLVAGLAVILLGMIFFFTLKRQMEVSSPRIAGARQIGATDTAVLLSWEGTDGADYYRVSYPDGANRIVVTESDIPYAVLRRLAPGKTFAAKIRAVSGSRESAPVSVDCRTENRCDVTAVHVTDVQHDTATVSWEYTGQNKGFTAIAYAVDEQGRRHLTTKAVTVKENEPPQCVMDGLYPELSYTVAVMPLTKYHRTGKSTFTVPIYSDAYNKLIFSRFVICLADSQNTPTVRSLKTVQPSSPYKVSLMFSGKTDSSHTVPVSLLILKPDGQLYSEYRFTDIPTNPENKTWYVQRFALLDFRSPIEEGDYQMVLIADGHRIATIPFQVRKE